MKISKCIFIAALFLSVGCNTQNDKPDILANMDMTADPCDDFYQYACGGWLASHNLPDDKSTIDASSIIEDKIWDQIIDLFTHTSRHQYDSNTIEYKVAKFYNSGIDTATINANGIKPIKFILDSIDNIKDVADLTDMIAIASKYGIYSPFDLFAGTDIHSNRIFVLKMVNYYFPIDAVTYCDSSEFSVKIRESYKKHLEKLLMIYGLDSCVASQSAKASFDIESNLAKNLNYGIDALDPNLTNNKITISELYKSAPLIDWNRFFSLVGCDNVDFVIAEFGTEYLTKLDELIRTIPIENWKAYFKCQAINMYAEIISRDFEDEDFDFYKRICNGQQEKEDKRYSTIRITANLMAEVIDDLYKKEHFNHASQQSVSEMVANIRDAFAEHIMNTDWLSAQTKANAIEKLDSLNIKIGSPDSLPLFYSSFVASDAYATNVINSTALYNKYEMSLVGKAIDKNFWITSAHDANAYYIKDLNDMEICAGILQPPFFHPNGDDAINYGAIGAVIGHELTHGFDNTGRLYGNTGNLVNWWTKSDSIEFEKRTETLVDRFDSFMLNDTLHCNGRLTLDENIADLGGLEIAYTAFTKTEQWKDQSKLIDGLTPDQRFFIAYAQSWATIYTDEYAQHLTLTNEHSLAKYRVEGPLPSIKAFIKAFNVKPGDKYYLPDSLQTHIW